MGGVLRAGAARGALGGGGWRLNASADRAAGRLLRRANASASQARAKPARERLLDVEALYKEGLVSDEERQALQSCIASVKQLSAALERDTGQN